MDSVIPTRTQLDHLAIFEGDHYVVEVNGKIRSAFQYTVAGLVDTLKQVKQWEIGYPTSGIRIVNPNRSDDTNPDGLTQYEKMIIESLEV